MQESTQIRRSIAYFSMEIGLNERIRTYSGGLGVLAGDTIRSAADLKIPMAAVTLLYRKGHFRQALDKDGWQREEPDNWAVGISFKIYPSESQLPLKNERFISVPGDMKSRGLGALWCRSTFLTPISRRIRHGTGR